MASDVTVTVLGVKGNQVSDWGINAPQATVAVHREEIFERIKREQAEEEIPETKSRRRLSRLE